MIERYSRKEVKKIWDEKNKYEIWLDIEIAAAQAMEKFKIIPRGVAANVKNKASINVKKIPASSGPLVLSYQSVGRSLIDLKPCFNGQFGVIDRAKIGDIYIIILTIKLQSFID